MVEISEELKVNTLGWGRARIAGSGCVGLYKLEINPLAQKQIQRT